MKALLIDFSRVLIFPYAEDVKSLNQHHMKLSGQPGYEIFDHFELNDELLSFLADFSDVAPMYVFTDGKLHGLPEIFPYLQDVFRGFFEVETLKLDKKKPGSYLAVAGMMQLPPDEIIFVDDKISNVEAAQLAGLYGIHYTANSELITELEQAF